MRRMALFPSLLVGEGQGGGCWRRSLIGYRSHPPLQLSPTRGERALGALLVELLRVPRRHPRARLGDLDVGGRRASPHRDGRHEAGHDGVGDDSGVKQPAPGARSFGLRAFGEIEGGAMGGPARCVWCDGRAGSRFAHGFFRRTGGAGSVTARGGDRKVSGGLDPIPSQRHLSLGLPSTGAATDMHGTVPAPTLRRLASAPLVRSQLLLAAGGMLQRREPDPGGKVPAAFEGLSRRGQRRQTPPRSPGPHREWSSAAAPSHPPWPAGQPRDPDM